MEKVKHYYLDFTGCKYLGEMLVHIKGLDTMPKEFDEDIAKMIEILKRAENECPNMKWVIEK